jgi:putative hemolysin
VIKIPKDFLDCAKNGGKVKTKKLKVGKFIRICYEKDGNSYAGEIMKERKKEGRN